MRKFSKAQILLLQIATVSFCQGSTLLVNPDFETGNTAGWEKTAISGIRPWALGQASPQSGEWYVFSVNEAILTQRFGPILGDDITEFNFWALRPSDSILTLEIFYASGASSGTFDFSSKISGGWANFDALSLIDSSREFTGFSISKLGTGTARLDNFTLTSIPEPSIGLMFLCSALSVFRRSRRPGKN